MITLMISCASSGDKHSNQSARQKTIDQSTNDSIQLTSLVRQVYQWHMTMRLNDFPYKYEKQSDSIFTGIDWDNYNKNIETFKKTKFFTDEFLSNHRTIASNIDSSMKKADIKWRNINDGIPLWDTDADDWCGCQDYPDNYWEFLILDSLKIENNLASFYWTWDIKQRADSHKYKMTAKKVDDKWMINSMEGFKYYGSVEYYDKIMND